MMADPDHNEARDDERPMLEVVRLRSVNPPDDDTLNLFLMNAVPFTDVGYPAEVPTSMARNLAIGQSRASWVVFLDHRSRPDDAWLVQLFADLDSVSSDPEVAVSVGRNNGTDRVDIAYRREALDTIGCFVDGSGETSLDFDTQLKLVLEGMRVAGGARALGSRAGRH